MAVTGVFFRDDCVEPSDQVPEEELSPIERASIRTPEEIQAEINYNTIFGAAFEYLCSG